MPRRNDIQKILVIGSGPIVIGQSAEFDYSGTQACKALKQEGYEVVLVNSNPATIMTDPDPVSYTHLDVYKRQDWTSAASSWSFAAADAMPAGGPATGWPKMPLIMGGLVDSRSTVSSE